MMKAKNFEIKFYPNDYQIYEKIELVRKGLGLTRKGMVLHALANTYPNLTEDLVAFLMKGSPASPNAKAALGQLKMPDMPDQIEASNPDVPVPEETQEGQHA